MIVGNEAHTLSYRQLRLRTLEILGSENFKEEITPLIEAYSAKMITPLFSASYSSSKEIQWHAISSFGYLARHLAKNDHSKIREIIRRCIWMLTEESGGIPWNAPAIMGEVMAGNKNMAEKFSSILLAYVDEPEEGPENFLDNLQLRISAYWGIFRLSQIFPEFVKKNEQIILQRLCREKDPYSITLLCMSAANAGLDNPLKKEGFTADTALVELYINEKFSILTPREVLG